MRFLVTLIFIIFAHNVSAEKKGEFTGYKLPRFVSLKSDNVNLRVGPSENYPIKLKYITQNFPVEIIDEYDVWRKIRDKDRNIGWIMGSLLKGDRYAIIFSKNENEIDILNFPNGTLAGKIGKDNVVKINKCLIEWCNIELKNYRGWAKKTDLWGVYKDEIYKINFTQPLINVYWKIISII